MHRIWRCWVGDLDKERDTDGKRRDGDEDGDGDGDNDAADEEEDDDDNKDEEEMVDEYRRAGPDANTDPEGASSFIRVGVDDQRKIDMVRVGAWVRGCVDAVGAVGAVGAWVRCLYV